MAGDELLTFSPCPRCGCWISVDEERCLKCVPLPKVRPNSVVVFYRLWVNLPHEVELPAGVFRLAIEAVASSERYELTAWDSRGGRRIVIGPSFDSLEALQRAVFEVGLKVKATSLAGTIVRKLVRDRLAVVVPAPYP